MNRVFLFSVLALAFATPAAASDYQRDLTKAEWANRVLADRYCLGDICLGMSLADTQALSGQVAEHEYNKWERNCSADLTKFNGLTYTAADGSQFNVFFRDMPGPGATEQRARISSVSLYVVATRRELDALVDPLVHRMSMDPVEPEVEGQRRWTHGFEDFSVELSEFHAPLPRRSLISLGSRIPEYQDWLRSQPSCPGVNSMPLL